MQVYVPTEDGNIVQLISVQFNSQIIFHLHGEIHMTSKTFNNNHYWIMSIWNLKYETWKCNTSLIKIYDRILNIYKWQSPCPDCPRWFLCQYYGPGTQGISSTKNHLLMFFCGTHKDLFIPECLSCFQLITTKRFIRSSHKAIVWFQKTWIILHASYWLLLWCCFCL